MTSLQLIEERISELEKLVFGSDTIKEYVTPETSVIDNILHANTLICSALKGREKMNMLIKRLPELNTYLDKNLDDCDLQSDAKVKLLFAVESEMKETLKLIKKVQNLMPVLTADKFKDVPELSQKLNNLTLNYLKANEETEVLNRDIHEMYSKYNAILLSISEVLRVLDSAVTAVEVALILKM